MQAFCTILKFPLKCPKGVPACSHVHKSIRNLLQSDLFHIPFDSPLEVKQSLELQMRRGQQVRPSCENEGKRENCTGNNVNNAAACVQHKRSHLDFGFAR